MKINKFRISIISALILSTTLAAEYIITVDIAKDSKGKSGIIVESAYDQYGFDENGNHRTGSTTDPDGFDSTGKQADNNSSVNISLNQSLSTLTNVAINPEMLRPNN